MIKCKTAMLSAAAAAAVSVVANAAEPGSTAAPYPPQVATNPGLPYSSARTPGPKSGPSNWIESPSHTSPSPATPNSGTQDDGGYYSKKGFGPAPN